MMFHALEANPEYINLQTEFVWLQQWITKKEKRVLLIFEGRDTAGKGGAIMRFVRFIDPRHYHIMALPKPTKQEKGQWYFQRYIKHLPNPGEISFFDRSWYNRAIVEPVMGFCTESQYKQFLEQVVSLEKMLIDDGVIIIKFWFSISIDEQKKRLHQREVNPLSQWKLSTVDALAQSKWYEYLSYKEEMFKYTAKPHSPWVVIDGNDKDKARLEAMRYVLNKINYTHKGETGERLSADPEVVTILT